MFDSLLPFFVPSSAIHSSGKLLFPLTHPPTVFNFLTLILHNVSQKCQHFLILQVLLFLLCLIRTWAVMSLSVLFLVVLMMDFFTLPLCPHSTTHSHKHVKQVSHCFPPAWVLKFPEVSGTELASK